LRQKAYRKGSGTRQSRWEVAGIEHGEEDAVQSTPIGRDALRKAFFQLPVDRANSHIRLPETGVAELRKTSIFLGNQESIFLVVWQRLEFFTHYGIA